jgi:hypothetical protein
VDPFAIAKLIANHQAATAQLVQEVGKWMLVRHPKAPEHLVIPIGVHGAADKLRLAQTASTHRPFKQHVELPHERVLGWCL